MANIDLPLPARNRVIRITNVHFDADENTIKDFFQGYDIQDQYRTINTRIGTKSIVYVLFAQGADKIRACSLSNSTIFDRVIKIQPAPSGNYQLNEEGTGFIKPDTSKPTPTKPVHGHAAPHFIETDFPHLGITRDKSISALSSGPVVAHSPAKNLVVSSTSMSPPRKDRTAQTNEASQDDMNGGFKPRNHFPWMFPDAADNFQAKSQWDEYCANQAAFREFYEKATRIQYEDQAYSAHSGSSRGAPSGVDTYIPPSSENWDLASNDTSNRSDGVVTEEMWYGFMLRQAAKVEKRQKDKGTHEGAIVTEAGGYEEEKE
ncbi:hypothetical protein FB567DRAFT_610949 [Paraphoma chrysanthemicola]|uniref:RRM domain-containing protein n=1 Tax=Paraphoma chrysanthemicola TaxID=798071 RepID=A0A8K0QXQ3_9PLEO|nr:hypothetical protein FB567DRAFT_610949 [Paraphoma chrysanthemicola]